MARTTLHKAALWHGVAATLVLAAIVLSGPLASLAQARNAAEPAYRLKTVPLQSGATVAARWNPCQRDITYQVNLSGLAADRRAAMLQQVQGAFTRLAAADGLHYRYAGQTAYVPTQATLADAPAEIVVAAVDRRRTDLDLAENSLGFGGVLWATWSGAHGEGAAVVRGYVVLNPTGITELTPGFGAGKTQGNVILHELGHATGLEHVDSADEQMNAVLTGDAPSGYGPGDLAGLRQQGIAAGCLSIPASVKIRDLD